MYERIKLAVQVLLRGLGHGRRVGMLAALGIAFGIFLPSAAQAQTEVSAYFDLFAPTTIVAGGTATVLVSRTPADVVVDLVSFTAVNTASSASVPRVPLSGTTGFGAGFASVIDVTITFPATMAAGTYTVEAAFRLKSGSVLTVTATSEIDDSDAVITIARGTPTEVNTAFLRDSSRTTISAGETVDIYVTRTPAVSGRMSFTAVSTADRRDRWSFSDTISFGSDNGLGGSVSFPSDIPIGRYSVEAIFTPTDTARYVVSPAVMIGASEVNSAWAIIQVIAFVDTTPPVWGSPVPAPAPVLLPRGMINADVSWTLPSVTDNSGTDPTVTCISGTLTGITTTGGTFLVGTHTITCTARDGAGNQADIFFTVTVTIDSVDPTFTVFPSDISMTSAFQATDHYVSYRVVAVDNRGFPNIVCTAPAGSAATGVSHFGGSFPVGATTVTCTATDTAGNEAMQDFTVTVIAGADAQPPRVSVPPAVFATTVQGETTANVTWTAVTASDNSGESPTPTCASADAGATSITLSGGTFPIGVSTVSCTATDTAGNEAMQDFTVTVTAFGVTIPTMLELDFSTSEVFPGASVVGSWRVTTGGHPGGVISFAVTDSSGDPAAFTIDQTREVSVGSISGRDLPPITVPMNAAADSYTITATFTPTGATHSGSSATALLTVLATIQTTTTLSVDSSRLVAGDDVTVTVTIGPAGHSGGIVSILLIRSNSNMIVSILPDITVPAGAVTGIDSQSTIPMTTLSGDYQFLANFTPAGDGTYLPSTTEVTINVTGLDLRPPVITVPTFVDAMTNPGETTADVVWPAVITATDDEGVIIALGCLAEAGSPATDVTVRGGNNFPIGDTEITCTATDSNGNDGSNSFTVTVTAAGSTVMTATVAYLAANAPTVLGGDETTMIVVTRTPEAAQGNISFMAVNTVTSEKTPMEGIIFFPAGFSGETTVSITFPGFINPGSYTIEAVFTPTIGGYSVSPPVRVQASDSNPTDAAITILMYTEINAYLSFDGSVSSPVAVVAGQSTMITVNRVSSGEVAGSVTFTAISATNPLNRTPLTGTADLPRNTLTRDVQVTFPATLVTGTHTVEAVFTPTTPGYATDTVAVVVARFISAVAEFTISGGTTPTTTRLTINPVNVAAGGRPRALVTVTPVAHPGGVLSFAVTDSSNAPAFNIDDANIDAEGNFLRLLTVPAETASGIYTVRVTFTPTGDTHATSSDTVTLTVTRTALPTTTSLVLDPANVAAGDTSQAFVTITPTTHPGGVISFAVTDSSNAPAFSLDDVEFTANGNGNFFRLFTVPAGTAAGSYRVRATFTPTGDTHSTSSDTATLTVTGGTAIATTTSLTLDYTSVPTDGIVRGSVTVTPAGATGSIQVLVDGSQEYLGAIRSVSFVAPAVGPHSVAARFFPVDGNSYTPSSSSAVDIIITATDTMPPVWQGAPPSVPSVSVPQGAINGDVSWTLPQVTDNSGVVRSFSCVAPTNSAATGIFTSSGTFSIGTHTVICSATDNAGNQADIFFTVTVNDDGAPDTMPPVWQGLPPSVASVTLPQGATSAFVSWALPSVTDNSGVTPTIVCTSGTLTGITTTGGPFSVGTHTVICTAIDAAGNTASLPAFTVTVNAFGTALPTTVTASLGDNVPTTIGAGNLLEIFVSRTPMGAGGNVSFTAVNTDSSASTPRVALIVRGGEAVVPFLPVDARVNYIVTFPATLALGSYTIEAVFNPTDTNTYNVSDAATVKASVGSTANAVITILSPTTVSAAYFVNAPTIITAGNSVEIQTSRTPATTAGNITFIARNASANAILTQLTGTASFTAGSSGTSRATVSFPETLAAGTYIIGAMFIPTTPGFATSPSVVVAVSLGGEGAVVTVSGGIADTISPVVSVPPFASATALQGQATADVTWTAVTASDNSGEMLAPICTSAGTGATSITASGGTFPVGTYTVICTATDSSNNQGSNAFTVTVTDAGAGIATTTSLTLSPNSLAAGGDVTAAVTVTPINHPGGTISFAVTDSNGPLALSISTISLAAGTSDVSRTFTLPVVTPAGSYMVTATFAPAGATHASSANTAPLTVTPSGTATTTLLSLFSMSADAGATVRGTVIVTPAEAAGRVSVLVDGTAVPIPFDSIAAGSSLLSISFPASAINGDHLVTVRFISSDTTAYANSVTASVRTLTVTGGRPPPTATTTLVSLSSMSAAAGSTVNGTVIVNPPEAVGRVSVLVNGTPVSISVNSIAAGSSLLSISFPAPAIGGDHLVTARFISSDAAAYADSVTATTTTLTVTGGTPTPTATLVSLSSMSAAPGSTVSGTVTVTPTAASGTVSVLVNNTMITRLIAVGSTQAGFTFEAPAVAGIYVVTARFTSSNTAYAHSVTTSPPTLTVTGGIPTGAATTTLLSIFSPSADAGATVRGTVIVNPPEAVGRVSVLVNGTAVLIPFDSIAAGSSLLSISFPAPAIGGDHLVTARFTSSNTAYANSMTTTTLTVTGGTTPGVTTTTLLSISSTSVQPGSTVNGTVTVTPIGASGTVSVLVNGNTITRMVAVGSTRADFTFSAPAAAGTYPVTASFASSDSTVFANSVTASPITLTVAVPTGIPTTVLAHIVGASTSVDAGGSVSVAMFRSPVGVAGTTSFVAVDTGNPARRVLLTASGNTIFAANFLPASGLGPTLTFPPGFASGSYYVEVVFTPTTPGYAATTARASDRQGSPTDAVITVTGGAGATTTVLSLASMSVDASAVVTGTVTVTPVIASGVVSVLVNGAAVTLASNTITAGMTALPISFTAPAIAGPYSVTASFSSTSTAYAGSVTASATTLTVTAGTGPAATATMVRLAPTSARGGSTVTASITVTPPEAAGRVRFSVSGSGFVIPETVTISAGGSVVGTSFSIPTGLAAGIYTISATFTPDDQTAYASSTNNAALTVTQSDVSTSVSLAFPGRVTVGDEMISLQTSVVPSVPGSLRFELRRPGAISGDPILLSTSPLAYPGQGVLTSSLALPAAISSGQWSVTVLFTPSDAIAYRTGVGEALLSVGTRQVTLALALVPTAPAVGASFTVTPVVTVAGAMANAPAPSGMIDVTGIQNGRVVVEASVPSSGTAAQRAVSLSATSFTSGSLTLTASFRPDDSAQYAGVTVSRVVTPTTNAATRPVQLEITSSTLSGLVGQPLNVTIRVTSGGAPVSGTGRVVTVSDGGASLIGAARDLPLASGTASLSLTPTSAGVFTIEAAFERICVVQDPANASICLSGYSSARASQSITVRATTEVRQSTLALTSSPSFPAAGRSVTLTARVSAAGEGAIAGMVSFSLNGASLASVPIAEGRAETTLTPSQVIAGTHDVEAIFAPASATILSHASARLSLIVGAAPADGLRTPVISLVIADAVGVVGSLAQARVYVTTPLGDAASGSVVFSSMLFMSPQTAILDTNGFASFRFTSSVAGMFPVSVLFTPLPSETLSSGSAESMATFISERIRLSVALASDPGGSVEIGTVVTLRATVTPADDVSGISVRFDVQRDGIAYGSALENVDRTGTDGVYELALNALPLGVYTVSAEAGDIGGRYWPGTSELVTLTVTEVGFVPVAVCGPFDWIDDGDGYTRTYIRVTGHGGATAVSATLENTSKPISSGAAKRVLSSPASYGLDLSAPMGLLSAWKLEELYGRFGRGDLSLEFTGVSPGSLDCDRLSRSSAVQALTGFGNRGGGRDYGDGDR